MKSILDYIKVFKNIETYKGPVPRNMAHGGRIGYEDGQLVRNTVDGSRPGYMGEDKITELAKKYQKATGSETTFNTIKSKIRKKRLTEDLIDKYKRRGAFGGGFRKKIEAVKNPKFYKTVLIELNKVKKQRNKNVFFDYDDVIKTGKWYKNLRTRLGNLNDVDTDTIVKKVLSEEFPGSYYGKTAMRDFRRDKVVKAYLNYLDVNGSLDGGEKRLKELKIFQGTGNKQFRNINETFKEWTKGEFEVKGVNRKKLNADQLKEIKNWSPAYSNPRSIANEKQLKFLNDLNTSNPDLSTKEVRQRFFKEFSDVTEGAFNHRITHLTQLKNSGAYTVGGGTRTFKWVVPDKNRSPWLKELLGLKFQGNYSSFINRGDRLLAQGLPEEANRLYAAAEKYFGSNGVFTKYEGQGEHPFSRVFGSGPIGNELKINSLVRGDLNMFKRLNFDEPVVRLLTEYNKNTTTLARRDELKTLIEDKKKLMNYLTESPNEKGIVESVKFNYGSKKMTVSVNVVDIDKVKNFNVEDYVKRGESYLEAFKTKGVSLFDESGEIIRQKLDLSTAEGRLLNRQQGTAKILNKILENNKIRICNDQLSNGKGVVCGTKFAERDPNAFLEAIKRNKDATKIINKPGLVKGALRGLSGWAKKELGPMGWIGSIATIDSAFGLHALGQGKTPLQALDTTLWFLPKSVLKADEKMFKNVYKKAGYTEEDFGEFQKWMKLEDLDQQYFKSSDKLEFMKSQVLEPEKKTVLEKGLQKEMDLQKDSPYANMGWMNPMFAITSEEERTGEHRHYGRAVDEHNRILTESTDVYESLKDPEKSLKDLDYSRKLAAMEEANRKKKLMRGSLKYAPSLLPLLHPSSIGGKNFPDPSDFMYDEYVHPIEGPSVSQEQMLATGLYPHASGGRAGYMGGGIASILKPSEIPPERQGLRSIMINAKDN